MNFKPALCPSCGGKMQVPDDANTIKCMYCGVEVIVREAIQLAGRVKEFTQATVIKKKTYNLAQASLRMGIGLGIIGFIFSYCASDLFSQKSMALAVGIPFAIISLLLIVSSFFRKSEDEKSIQEVALRPELIEGYEGLCPYCDTKIILKPDVLGENCPACQKRIVIRDSKFYSVETPVGGLDKNLK